MEKRLENTAKHITKIAKVLIHNNVRPGLH